MYQYPLHLHPYLIQPIHELSNLPTTVTWNVEENWSECFPFAVEVVSVIAVGKFDSDEFGYPAQILPSEQTSKAKKYFDFFERKENIVLSVTTYMQ